MPDSGAGGEPPIETTALGTAEPDGEIPGGSNGTLDVHFINVGQSTSTLIVSPTGETMLIDTGDFKDDGRYVLGYLRRHDIDRIDFLVTSHNDADHIGGHARIIEYYETRADGIGAVYDPGIAASTQTYDQYLDAVERYDVPLYRTLEGDSIPMDGVDVSVLGPPQPYLENLARNENSIVLRLSYGSTTLLFPGDAEDDQEQYLVDTYGDQLAADVLQAGHHGSNTSSSGRFLDAVGPRVAILSSAFDSRYGHPSEQTLHRLADRSIAAYWTGVHGDILLVSDGRQSTIATQSTAPTIATALRSGNRVAPGSTAPLVPRARLTDSGLVPVNGTPVATTPPPGTAVPDGGVALSLVVVHADAAGDDRENLADEYITFANTGAEPLDMGEWTVTDAAGRSYTLPEQFTLAPGETVTLRTGTGTDTERDLYWNAGQPVWNNDGDTVTVTTRSGTVVLEETY